MKARLTTIQNVERRYAGTRIPEQCWQRLEQTDTTAVILADYEPDRTELAVCSRHLPLHKTLMMIAATQPKRILVVQTGADAR